MPPTATYRARYRDAPSPPTALPARTGDTDTGSTRTTVGDRRPGTGPPPATDRCGATGPPGHRATGPPTYGPDATGPEQARTHDTPRRFSHGRSGTARKPCAPRDITQGHPESRAAPPAAIRRPDADSPAQNQDHDRAKGADSSGKRRPPQLPGEPGQLQGKTGGRCDTERDQLTRNFTLAGVRHPPLG